MSNVIDFKTGKPKNTNTQTWGLNQPHQLTNITFSIDEGEPLVFLSEDLKHLQLTLDTLSKQISEIPDNPKLDAVHEATFDICLMCEEHPGIAEYAERKLRELHTALTIYKNNHKNG
jgi:hypothetical protein